MIEGEARFPGGTPLDPRIDYAKINKCVRRQRLPRVYAPASQIARQPDSRYGSQAGAHEKLRSGCIPTAD